MPADEPRAAWPDGTTRGAPRVDADSAGRKAGRRRWRAYACAAGLLVLALLGAAAYLRWPQFELPAIADLLARAQRWRASPLAPWIALACFIVGGFVVFPVNLLTAATIIVLGPIAGAACAMAGCVLSAAAVQEVGRLLPSTLFARVAGERGERLRLRIVGHGVAAIALVRLVPIAPYSVVSVVAGAARIRRGSYLLGTALGMAPGVGLYAIFVDRARAVLLDPHPLAWLGLGVAFALIVAVAIIVRLRSGSGSAPEDT